MFETVILDLTAERTKRGGGYYEDIDEREVKLFPSIYLVAKKVIEAGV